MKLAAIEIARLLQGRLEAGSGGTPIENVSIDSRTVAGGDLFFAIVGRNRDGHEFIAEAMERGAAGAVVSRPISTTRSGVIIRVEDTTAALQELARAVRRMASARVVAITGSMGKTTTKEAVAAALSARFRVLKTGGNLNNLYGLPLSILRHRDEDVAVLEMGMSMPGEIARLTEIADPDVGVVTNVAEVHREFFPSLEAIAEAKGELFAGLRPEAVAIVNADDPLVLAQARRFSGRQIRYGVEAESDLKAEAVERTEEGLRFRARSREGEEVVVRASLFGRHQVYNLLAALAVARVLGVPLASAAEKLAGLEPAPHRGERLRFAEGFLVIDESYNSNPSALAASLRALAEETGGRRIAVLGDMLELGGEAEDRHREGGRLAAQLGLALLVGVGPLGRVLVEGARRAGMPEEALACAADAEQAGEILDGGLRSGDVVLLKASRGVRLERALDRLQRRFRREFA